MEVHGKIDAPKYLIEGVDVTNKIKNALDGSNGVLYGIASIPLSGEQGKLLTVNSAEDGYELLAPKNAFSKTFNNTTDWGTASGGLYTITILNSEHGLGVNIGNLVCYELVSTDYVVVTPDTVSIGNDGTVKISVSSAIDGRFTGKAVLVPSKTIVTDTNGINDSLTTISNTWSASKINEDYFRKDGSVKMTGKLNELLGANIASASTINLDTATGNTLHITGTTTINSITLESGKRISLIFDGVLVLTHSDNLILPDSVNMVTYAGYFITVVGEGSGVVRVVNYLGINNDGHVTINNAGGVKPVYTLVPHVATRISYGAGALGLSSFPTTSFAKNNLTRADNTLVSSFGDGTTWLENQILGQNHSFRFIFTFTGKPGQDAAFYIRCYNPKPPSTFSRTQSYFSDSTETSGIFEGNFQGIVADGLSLKAPLGAGEGYALELKCTKAATLTLDSVLITSSHYHPRQN